MNTWGAVYPVLFFALMITSIPIIVNNIPLEKASDSDLQETEYLLPIRAIVNTMTEDKDNETMSKAVFSEDTVKYFLERGHIDWWHRVNRHQDSRAMIGRPASFQYTDKPIVYGYLVKDTPIVKETIMPFMKAGIGGFSASMGGYITEMDGSLIKKIHWDNLAIAPASKVRSEGSDIALLKADSTVSLTYGCIGEMCGDLSMRDGMILSKAIEAEAVTSLDSIQTSMGAVQGLPGTIYHDDKKKKNDLLRAFELFKSRELSPNTDTINRYFYMEGYINTGESSGMTQKLLNLAKEKINGSR
jgi:hypothetical protein